MLVLDNCQTIAVCIMVFKILPHLDMLRALLLMPCVCVLPGVVKTCAMWAPSKLPNWLWKTMNGVACLVQVASLLTISFSRSYLFSETEGPFRDHLATYTTVPSNSEPASKYWYFFAMIFVSLRYCENFIELDYFKVG